MIVCKLELWPGGIEEGKEDLGRIEISNNVFETVRTEGRRGNYSYKLFKKRAKRIVCRGRVQNFPRLSYHPWELVREILNDAARKNGRI